MKRAKKILLVLITLFTFSVSSYAAIGNYNFLIGIGGGYSTSQIYNSFEQLPSGFYVDMPIYELNAAVVRVDLGLPLHWAPHKNALVHALDIRANFTASFAKGTVLDTSSGKIEQKINSFGGGGQIVYGLGVAFGDDKISGSKLVFDILGFGLSVASDNAERTLTYTDSSKSSQTLKDSRVSTKIEYIVPGIHYFDKSGLTLGLRNTFQFIGYNSLNDSKVDFPSVTFTTYAYIGYTFNTTRSK